MRWGWRVREELDGIKAVFVHGYARARGHVGAKTLSVVETPRRNVEIKARIRDLHAQTEAAARIADHGPERIHQVDTFFHSTHGRLKLREFADGSGELIYYERPNDLGPRESKYVICPVERASELLACLEAAFGVRGTVRKERQLYLAGQTRIHFDSVNGLGEFIELEVVLRPEQTVADGMGEANRLMSALGISTADLEPRAYVDLLNARHGVCPPVGIGLSEAANPDC